MKKLNLLLLSMCAACGGSSEPGATNNVLFFSPPALSVHAGEVATPTVRVEDASVPSSSLRWISSNYSVVSVDSTGAITGIAPGTARITASMGQRAADLSVTVPADLDPTGFVSPFAGSFAVVSVFDHDLPFEFSDTNGYLLSFWGEKLNGIDGHNGYDWLLPQGTPVIAAGAGTVVVAGPETPFVCPLLNSSTVSGLAVQVMHGLTGGDVDLTLYDHFSRIDVKVGDRVAAGQQLGLSGSTGCSTTPHLHFGLSRRNPKTGIFIVVDPYGWQGTASDPWSLDSLGAASSRIWTATGAPDLYQGIDRAGAYPKPRFVDIKHFRLAGIDDDHNPNNEFVEFDVKPDTTWDFGADTLRNGAGDRFVFPPKFVVAGGNSVRIYSGSGTNTASVLYMGRSTPLWRNYPGDCLLLIDKLNRTLAGTTWGTGCGTAASAVRPLPGALDYRPPRPLIVR
jgi:murein DD-endopeptidase MepM/ murein hydrolase activator NlpD